MVKEDLKSCIIDIERERRKALTNTIDKKALVEGSGTKPRRSIKGFKATFDPYDDFPKPVFRNSVDAFIKK